MQGDVPFMVPGLKVPWWSYLVPALGLLIMAAVVSTKDRWVGMFVAVGGCVFAGFALYGKRKKKEASS
jgi:hypothetical protein